jgi:hypothetical protein
VVVESFTPAAVYHELKLKGMARVGACEICCKRVDDTDIEQVVLKVPHWWGEMDCVFQAKSIQLDGDERARKLLVQMKEATLTTTNGDTATFAEITVQLDLPVDP